MSYQQHQLEQERMQRTLNALVSLWWCVGTDEDALMFLATELGVKNEFIQMINPKERKHA